MEKTTVEYNNKTYPAILIELPPNHPSEPDPGETVLIAGDRLGNLIWSEQCGRGWPDEAARCLDEEIAYYIPDALLNADEETLKRHLVENY